MVYYLRPHKKESSKSSLLYRAALPSNTGDLESENSEQFSVYLVVFLLVTVISTLVILLAVKPDENGFSFLCVKDEKDKCQVSTIRVLGVSLLLGLLVSASIYGINKAKPGTLKL